VRKSHSRTLAACCRRNSVQVSSSRLGAGSIPASPQDRPDGARRELDPESDQLALNPPVAPTRVLAREPHHQLAQVQGRSGATRTPMRVRPATRNKLTVPAQHRPRRRERRSPPRLPRQHATERGKKRPVSLRQLRTSDLPLKHSQLVAEEKDLDLLLPLSPTPEHDQLKQPPKRPIEKRQNHASRTTRHRD
jgi:hypothetical protein